MTEPLGAMLVGEHYARVRQRLTGLLSEATPDELIRPVPSCPGWRVRDVLAHLLGTVEDGIAGRIRGVPDEAMTAGQVERHLDDDVADMLEEWGRLAPLFEGAISERNRLPAAIDVLTHEFDIRQALDRPGGRSDPLVSELAQMFAGRLAGDAEVIVDGTSCTPPAPLTLDISSFELVRVVMGRRTSDQAAALAWEGDPTDVLPRLFVFGPAQIDIIE